MNRIIRVAMLVGVGGGALAASPLSAQQRPGGVRPGARTVLLRQQIEQLFMQQARNQLALTDEQAPKMERVVAEFAQKRLQLDAEDRALATALRGQERPGVAGNPDSISKLVTALEANRVATAESFRDEMAALAPILTPVQLGQYQLLSDRLLEKIRELQQQKPAQAGRAGPPPAVDSTNHLR